MLNDAFVADSSSSSSKQKSHASFNATIFTKKSHLPGTPGLYITYSRQLRVNSELMNHQYGRFDYQLREVTLKITHERLFLQISTDKHGSSLINKLIKVLANLLLVCYVMATLNRLFKFLMMSTFGSSVILQCLHLLYKKKNDLLYRAASDHCLFLACHEQGCFNMEMRRFTDKTNFAFNFDQCSNPFWRSLPELRRAACLVPREPRSDRNNQLCTYRPLYLSLLDKMRQFCTSKMLQVSEHSAVYC